MHKIKSTTQANPANVDAARIETLRKTAEDCHLEVKFRKKCNKIRNK